MAVDNVPTSTWELGTPIITMFGGHNLTEEVAQRDVAGGYNHDFIQSWDDLDVAEEYGIRARLRSDYYLGGLLWPESLDGGTQQVQLDALIDQYKASPRCLRVLVRGRAYPLRLRSTIGPR